MSYGINFINDSYYHTFPFLTSAYNYSLMNGKYGNISINATAILGLRTTPSGDSKKATFGIVPGMIYKYDKVSLNYNFSPTVDTGATDGETIGFHYFSIGVDF